MVGEIGSTTIYSVPGESTPASFTVNVDRPPTASDGAVTVPVFAGTVTIPVATYASDPDGDALTVTAAGPALHGQVSVANGAVSYTPPASGTTDAFPYTVSDGRGGAASATVDITLDNLQSQTITASGPSTAVAGDGGLVVTGSASSGLAVTFSTSTPDVCTVGASGGVTALTAGTCTVIVSQDGDSTYAPAVPATVSFPVTAATQTITFPVSSQVFALGSPVTLSATASSGLPVEHSTATPDVCSVTGDRSAG